MNDVIIIGGGPAGSTAASYLAMKGHQVLLLEKEKFPREHVGESLLPFCYKIFDELGVLDQMKRNYVRKPGVRFIDKDGLTSTTWCFNHVIHDESYLSFQVVRSRFDQLLLNNSRRLGVSVLEETRVNGVNLQGPDGLVEVKTINSEGKRHSYKAKFIIDCSGRNAFLASSEGLRKKYPDLDRTALTTHFKGAEYTGGIEEGLALIVYMGGEKKGWAWVFPLEKDRVTVGVVLNNDYIRAQRAKFADLDIEDWKLALYQQEIGYSPFVSRVLANAKMMQPLTVEGDYSYYSEKKFGENFAMIGDAATFIDPIFASGIYLAMNSARLVAEAVHQKLDSSNGQQNPLVEAYSHIEGAYKLVHRLINFFYSANSINFAQMDAASNLVHKEFENAMATAHFMLAGDFFDRHKYYGKIIDQLENPRIYDLYKKTIINHPESESKACKVIDETIFPEMWDEDTAEKVLPIP
jgi:flavin-dependent dehydrogenase